MLQLRHSLIIIAVLLGFNAAAQTRQKLHIETATIFLRGAELTSTATIPLSKGANEILLTNVAVNVNTASIIVNATNNVVVESAVFQRNNLHAETPSPRIAIYNDSINRLAVQLKQATIKADVLEKQIDLLESKSDEQGDDKNGTIVALTQMLDLIAARLEAYYVQKNKQDEIVSSINTRIALLNALISEENNKGTIPGAQLLVKFYAPEAGNTEVSISYMIPDASWSPIYDVVADNVNRPIKFYYKANVRQSSGIIWNNVKLTLSTGNPDESIQAPTLVPWYVSFYTPPQPVAATNYNSGSATAEVTVKWKKPLIAKQPGMTLSGEEVKQLATTQVSDVASLTPATFQGKRGAGISAGGARKTGTLYVIDGVEVQNIGVNDYVLVNSAGMNTSFDIDLPYTIPADGQMHLVTVKKYELPATYRYYTIPKVDRDVFLQAEVTKWENFDLMPGPANIFYDGTYVGQCHFDTRIVKDTLLVSLGRDKKIVVKRELDAKKRSIRTMGANVREEFAYTITIRNARKQPIDLVVFDQVPVSNESDLEIENIETNKGELNKTTGIIKWELSPQPAQSSTLRFGYTIKYPKDKSIVGLK